MDERPAAQPPPPATASPPPIQHSLPPSTTATATHRHGHSYNVDYFSHPWTESDLRQSWSVVTKRKKTHVDGIRLENASWRKWMQQRLNLRRVRPESLRWKKDEDITWLYGPFFRGGGMGVVDGGGIGGGVGGGGAYGRDIVDISTAYSKSPVLSSPTRVLSRHTRTGSAPALVHDWKEQVPLQPQVCTPPAATGADSPRGLKSALKRADKSTITSDLRKFQSHTSRRLAAMKFSYAPALVPALGTTSPLQEQPEPSRSLSHSSSNLSLRDAASSSDKFLDQNETSLLQYMDGGPLSTTGVPAVPHPSTRQNDLLVDSSRRNSAPDHHGQQLSQLERKMNRLRFNSRVEVLEYDTAERLDRFAVVVPGRQSSSAAAQIFTPPFATPQPPPPSTTNNLSDGNLSDPPSLHHSSSSSSRDSLAALAAASASSSNYTGAPTVANSLPPVVEQQQPPQPQQQPQPVDGGWFGVVYEIGSAAASLLRRGSFA